MIKASYYRDLITPAPLSERELDMRLTAVVERGKTGKRTRFAVRLPRVDVERAREKLMAYEYQVVAVNPATPEELAAAIEVAGRIGGYAAEDFVEDEIVFKLPELPRQERRP